MRNPILMLALLSLAGTAAARPASGGAIVGDYLEARTAEVFTGGCIMGSEGETSGREAILAWHVAHGQVNGVTLDDLTVVAIVTGDRNLGTHELGGGDPADVKSAIRVDGRATPAQKDALVTLAQRLAPTLVRGIVDVKTVPIAFRRSAERIDVEAGEATLRVTTRVDHSPTCGALQWFKPLAATETAQIGTTREQAWTGTSLGTQWSQGDRRSSFFGSFSLAQ